MESFERYKTQLKEDESTLNKDPLSNRQRYSLFVNYGQKKILQKLVDCLS